MKNNNGFDDALKQMKTLLKVDKKVTLDVLEEAAEYFAKKLKPRINMSDKKKKTHLRNSLKVVVEKDMVQVVFDDDAWYWFLAEHGHLVAEPGKRLSRRKGKRIARTGTGKKRVKGLHFVRNTWDKENEKVASMLAEKIIKKME